MSEEETSELADKNQRLLLEIIERKRAEQVLRESEIEYRALVEHIPAITYIAALDETSTTLYISPRQIEQILGFAPSEWEDDGYDIWSRQLHPDDRARVLAEVTAGRASCDPFAMEYRMLTRAGEVVWIRDEAVVATDEAGQPLFQHGAMFDITERKQAEEALATTQALLMAAIEQTPAGVLVADAPDVKIRIANAAALGIRGETSKPLTDIPFSLHPGRWQTFYPDGTPYQPQELPLSRAVLNGEVSRNVEVIIRRETGEDRWVSANAAPVRNADGEIVAGVVVFSDITERKTLEDQLRQAQKLEAIGRLAGGVSHDFNNLITSIMGYTELALNALQPTDPVRSDLEGIQKTAERAAGLTQQLLAFARKQVINPTILNLNELILNVDKMLRRLIGEDIELVTLLSPELGQVKADAGQLEQVLLNLAVNARDAMPQGGKLFIKTANVVLGKDDAHRLPELKSGEYILLTVSDTGVGMTDDVKSHIFEPFFTTKEKSRGTGLGLATCFGIVKQNDGHIWVDSEIGRGTIFEIYLPRTEEAASSPIPQQERDELPRGTETILLVEDEPVVRDLIRRMLREQGFKVIEAANGEEALRVAREHTDTKIQLLLTDLVMPRLGGGGLADKLKRTCPDLKVLFISGYSDNTIVHQGIRKPTMEFLQKPFTPSVLIHRVREMLDRKTNS